MDLNRGEVNVESGSRDEDAVQISQQPVEWLYRIKCSPGVGNLMIIIFITAVVRLLRRNEETMPVGLLDQVKR